MKKSRDRIASYEVVSSSFHTNYHLKPILHKLCNARFDIAHRSGRLKTCSNGIVAGNNEFGKVPFYVGSVFIIRIDFFNKVIQHLRRFTVPETFKLFLRFQKRYFFVKTMINYLCYVRKLPLPKI